jgi:HEPN domain-containing protein
VLSRKAKGDAKAMLYLAPNPDIDDESIGFHAQQAIEKWIKAVMAYHDVPQVRTHDLGELLDVLAGAGIEAPPGSGWLNDLSIYAVPMRYDDRLDLEPLDRDAVVRLVDEVGDWAARFS